MEWLQTQAQQASPFIATFCLFALSIFGVVLRMVWKQLLFERAEHRTSEKAFTDSALLMAKAMERLAVTVDRPRRAPRRERQ